MDKVQEAPSSWPKIKIIFPLQWKSAPILSVFPALIVHSELKSVHPGFPRNDENTVPETAFLGAQIAPKSLSAEASPQTHWASLQRSPDPLAGFKGPYS